MKSYYILSILAIGALAQSSTSSSTTPSAAATSSSPDYTITAVSGVMSFQTSIPCIWNCLIPIGLADPSGCDDVSNDCACLSAPAGAQEVITNCINTVCKSSTSQYASIATSLYQSYCNSLFPASVLSSATSAESVSDALAAASSSSSVSSTASTMTSTTATATATSKSEAGVWQPSLYVSHGFQSRASISNVGIATLRALAQFSDFFCLASFNVLEQQALEGSAVMW